MSRPTKYTKEQFEKAEAFVKDSTQFGYVVPSAAALAVVLGVGRKTLYNWGDAHPEFLHMLDQLQTTQEAELLENGLKSIFNPVITKLMLGKHGYTDKQEITGKDGAPLMNDENKAKAKAAITSFRRGNSR